MMDKLLILLCGSAITVDDVTVALKAPEKVAPGSVFETQVTVIKNDLTGFARITIELPPNTQSVPVDVKDGNFSVQNDELKIIWMELPGEKSFTVKFSLSFDREIGKEALLKGHFAYVVGNEKKMVPITTVSIIIEEDAIVSATPAHIPSEKPGKKSRSDNTGIIGHDAGDGVHFTVQIASSSVKYKESFFREKYHLSDPVKSESVNGAYKYLVGSFSDYDSATGYRKKLAEQYHIGDAFVVAYKDGKRIPVSEAVKQQKKQ